LDQQLRPLEAWEPPSHLSPSRFHVRGKWGVKVGDKKKSALDYQAQLLSLALIIRWPVARISSEE